MKFVNKKLEEFNNYIKGKKSCNNWFGSKQYSINR